MAGDDHREIMDSFKAAVNMTTAALEKWLETDESSSVGWADGANKTKSGGTEAVGHREGHRIVEMRRKKTADLTEEDYQHMKKVVGYVHRHMAQKPSADVEHSRWRHSLMNWGHDPLKR